MEAKPSLLIVGAGVAASELALQCRQGGWTGDITLIGDEPVLPYNRPPLSKTWLDAAPDLASLLVRPQAAYHKAGIACITGRGVTAIDRPRKQLHLADGEVMAYSQLALCTGGRPRPWAAPGLAAGDRPANLHVLRSLADAERLRPVLVPGARLVVVGAGYVGLEVAATARKRGASVMVVEAQPRVLARSTGASVSGFYADLHRGHGVDLRTATTVQQVERAGDRPDAAITALCIGGHGEAGVEQVPCDQVLVGIGLLPNAELAAAAGLAVDGGVLVDELSRTSDPDIVAAGDCCVRDLGGGRRLRLESVPNALEQARAAASWLTGQPRPNRSVPWFWSDQYGLKLQMVGLSAGHERVLLRGPLGEQGFVAFYLQGDQVIAAEAINRPAEFMQAKRLVAARCAVNGEQLVDESLPLKDLVTAALATTVQADSQH